MIYYFRTTRDFELCVFFYMCNLYLWHCCGPETTVKNDCSEFSYFLFTCLFFYFLSSLFFVNCTRGSSHCVNHARKSDMKWFFFPQHSSWCLTKENIFLQLFLMMFFSALEFSSLSLNFLSPLERKKLLCCWTWTATMRKCCKSLQFTAVREAKWEQKAPARKFCSGKIIQWQGNRKWKLVKIFSRFVNFSRFFLLQN